MKYLEKIIVLGTGDATAIENFNTCFVLQDNDENHLLVDTGGGNEILKQLRRANIDITKIHNIFISHKHTDHLFGFVWIYRFIDLFMRKGIYEGDLHIWCNDEVADVIKNQLNIFLRGMQKQFIDKRIFINVVQDRDKIKVFNYELECFDILSKNDKQYGFKTILNNGKTLVFHGDEPLKEELYDFVRNSDYLLHESYCLETEANIYEPRKRNHDTVKSVSLKAQNLGIKNLVIWHTLENLGKDRKNRYMKEAKENFSGNVFVPNDLELIDL